MIGKGMKMIIVKGIVKSDSVENDSKNNIENRY